MIRNDKQYFVVLQILILLLSCLCVFNNVAAETFWIPVNGYSDSHEHDSQIMGTALYAAQLSESLECHEKNCEEQIIRALDEYYISELTDFYTVFLLNENDDLRLNEEAIIKLKSMRLLEQFLRQSNYENAANRLDSMFQTKVAISCVSVSSCTNNEDKACENSCLNKSLMQLLKDIPDAEDRKALLEAFSPNNQDVQNSIDKSCGIHQENPDTKSNSESTRASSSKNAVIDDKKWKEQNKKLCGILTSDEVLRGFAHGSTFYAGNAQSDSSAEYECLGARLAIDRTQTTWRPDPDRPKLLYVIYKDKTVYRLNDEDLLALQNAVKGYTLKVQPKIRNIQKTIGPPKQDKPSAQ